MYLLRHPIDWRMACQQSRSRSKRWRRSPIDHHIRMEKNWSTTTTRSRKYQINWTQYQFSGFCLELKSTKLSQSSNYSIGTKIHWKILGGKSSRDENWNEGQKGWCFGLVSLRWCGLVIQSKRFRHWIQSMFLFLCCNYKYWGLLNHQVGNTVFS